MNTAFLDAQNLAWKIHHVESGFAKRSILSSYESERKSVAESLLDFDAEYAKLFSSRKPTASEVDAASQLDSDQSNNEFVKLFKSSREFTSGYGVAYGPNEVNWHNKHPASSSLFQPKGTTLRTGRLLPPANVRRVVDANEVQLEYEVPVNGAFRIYVFAGKRERTQRSVSDLASNLTKKNSFYRAYELHDVSKVSHHEMHNPHSKFFTICTIYANERASIDMDEVPAVLARYRTHVYADEISDLRVIDAVAPAHAKMGIDQQRGAVVVVRPDAYVGCVVALVEGSGTVDAINDYFAAFTVESPGMGSILHASL